MKFDDYNGKSYYEIVTEFIEFIEHVKEIYYRDVEVVNEMNKEQQNLIHSLEFDNFSYHEFARFGKNMQAFRRNRRTYKNEYILAEPIKNFYKDKGPEYFDDLRKLAEELKDKSEWVKNQKYNHRETVSNITTMNAENSNDQDKIDSEDLIALKRVFNKYTSQTTLNMYKEDGSDAPLIKAELQLDTPFNLTKGKKYITGLGINVEKFYKPGLKDIKCETSSSDIIMPDKKGRNTLSGTMNIIFKDNIIYCIHLTIREGKRKSKKGGKKRK